MTDQPKLPRGLSNRLSDAELRELLAEAEAQIGPLEPLLALSALDDDQLASLVAAKTSDEVAALERQFAAGQQPQRPRRKVRVTK